MNWAGLLLALALGGTSVQSKLDLIENDRVPAGSVVTLKQPELNDYVRREAPAGVRDPRLELGQGRADATAYLDFVKLSQAQGRPMGRFMSWLLEGERPVKVSARIASADGKATVDVERVEVAGVPIEGRALDYLIRNYLHSYYPEAKVGEPFELAHGIERVDVQPGQVQVVMGRR